MNRIWASSKGNQANGFASIWLFFTLNKKSQSKPKLEGANSGQSQKSQSKLETLQWICKAE